MTLLRTNIPQTPESLAYQKAYDAAKVADDAYSAACVKEYGRADGRWQKHTDPQVLAARRVKVAADAAMWDALLKMRNATLESLI